MTAPGNGSGGGHPVEQPSAVPPPASPPPAPLAFTRNDLEQARRASAEIKSASSEELISSEDAKQDKKDRRWNRVLRMLYGLILLVLLIGQVAAADYGFYLYGQGNAWHIPPQAIIAWLSAGVVEVIGVVIVIVKFLFSKDSSGGPGTRPS